MYKGTRDAYIRFEIPNTLCFSRILSGQIEWIEIFVPPSTDYSKPTELWKSFMVQPCQVFWKNDYLNIVDGINARAKISICQHEEDINGYRKIVPNTIDLFDPHDIIRNIDNYQNYINCTNRKSAG